MESGGEGELWISSFSLFTVFPRCSFIAMFNFVLFAVEHVQLMLKLEL